MDWSKIERPAPTKTDLMMDEIAKAAYLLPRRKALAFIFKTLGGALLAGIFVKSSFAAGHCNDNPSKAGCLCGASNPSNPAANCPAGTSCKQCGNSQFACTPTASGCCTPGTSQGNGGDGSGGKFCASGQCCCTAAQTCSNSTGTSCTGQSGCTVVS